MSVFLTEDPTDAFRVYRLSLEQFERAAEAGAFRPNGPLELLNGVLAEKPTVSTGHVTTVARLHNRLTLSLQQRAAVFAHSALECGQRSLARPDLAVVSLPYERYYERRPKAADVLLVIELTDSSLHDDPTVKALLYGSHGIPETWVVDLRRRRVDVHTDPTTDGYATTTTLAAAETLVPSAFPDIEIPVDDLALERLP